MISKKHSLSEDPKFIAAAAVLTALFPQQAPNAVFVADALMAAGKAAHGVEQKTDSAMDGCRIVRDRAAAKMLGCHFNSIRNYAARGLLKRVRIGKNVGVTLASIEALIAANPQSGGRA